MNWLELARRCEAARGPDREIDVAIMEAVAGSCAHPPPALTASFDAIAVLIQQKSAGHRIHVLISDHYSYAKLTDRDGLDAKRPAVLNERADNLCALALCAAFCRVMADGARGG